MRTGSLACLGSLAVLIVACANTTDTKVQPAALGGKGESCEARNDCAEGLACVRNTCLQNDFPITVLTKQCDFIQCETAAECCEDFLEPSYCASYQASCTAGDQTYCQFYQQSCVCKLACEENRCVASNTCATTADCASGTCSGGKCVACTVDADCVSTTLRCIAGACKAGCTSNDECPPLNDCVSGQCTERDCRTQRECIGVTGSMLAECAGGKCRVPCEADAECEGNEVCEAGECVFIGCETNDDCRHLFPSQVSSGVTAVCR